MILVVLLQVMSPSIVAQQKNVHTQSVLFTETRMSNGMMISFSEIIYEIEIQTEFMPMHFTSSFSQEFSQNFEPTSEKPVTFSWRNFKEDERILRAEKNLDEMEQYLKLFVKQLGYNGPIGLAVIKLD